MPSRGYPAPHMANICAFLTSLGMACTQGGSVEDLTIQAAAAVGVPHMGPVVARIAARESRGDTRVKVHAGDSWASHRVWERAVAKGWLDPECQPYGDGGWSTRGAHGLMAAYSLRFLPELQCAGPEVLDHPAVSAIAAVRRARSTGGDCEAVAEEWAGRGRWAQRSWLKRWTKAWEVCDGPPPSMVWTFRTGLILVRLTTVFF
jgi:hypothetical protein